MCSVVNQAAVEALCSATYLDDYIDCLDSLPDDLQRCITRLRELDCRLHDYLQDLKQNKEVFLDVPDGPKKQSALAKIQRSLILCQETGDEKLKIAASVLEIIENRTRRLEQNLENLDPATATSSVSSSKPTSAPPSTSNSTTKVNRNDAKPSKSEGDLSSVLAGKKRSRRQRVTPGCSTAAVASPVVSATDLVSTSAVKEEKKTSEEEDKPPKKKRKKKGKQKVEKTENPLEEFEIDPDEPTYCLCNRVSYGEMIGCDYDQCQIEWFHFDCVGLNNKPKGKWFCPHCRGDKPTVKRADLK